MILPLYSKCCLCPRRCGVDRSAGNRGFCGETAELRIASASIHRGEEPPITGTGGSGTIFISGCTLGCVFCQNYQISHKSHGERGLGRVVLPEEFTRICLELQGRGAENINIVTGSHAIPAIALGIQAARSGGLRIPALWNSSAYEGIEGLSLLEDAVDVYLPDLKTLDAALSRRFFNAPDYPDRAVAAIQWMLERRGTLRYKAGAGLNDASGTEGGVPQVLASGVMIRHLALPDHLESTRRVLRWFADNAQGRALLSLMTQYTPVTAMNSGQATAGDIPGRGAPQRFLNEREYETILSWLEEFGIEDGFCQELVTGNDWLPDFRRGNPFSSELSVPVWHWQEA